MPEMIRLRRGTVASVLRERPGAAELSVEVEGEPEPAAAIAYPQLVGPVGPGDRVVLNTMAVELALGTGGMHIVVAVEGGPDVPAPAEGRIVKLRYTPHQVNVRSAEEPGSPHRDALLAADGLHGTPVVWVPLHSMIAPVAAGVRAAGVERVVYVMTDGAALPAGLSRLAATLRTAGLLDAVVTCGQAFGGDVEAVTVFTGLLVARFGLGAEVIVVGDGPGNTGTDSEWGATAVSSAMSLNAIEILGGRPVAALRISFAEQRERHRGVSHHSLTALGRVARSPVHVAVPSIDDDARREVVWDALKAAKLEEKHQLVEVGGEPALDRLRAAGIEVASMGRTPGDDPEFFLAAGAAGGLAGRVGLPGRARGGPQ